MRTTHEFLTVDDIAFFKSVIVEQGFPAVTLFCAKDDDGRILGFIGIAGQKVEMLCLRSHAMGRGIDKQLLHMFFISVC